MKKTIAIFIILISFITCPICIAAYENTDLPVYEEGIAEKKYSTPALTDLYNIEIFTASSREIQEKRRAFSNENQQSVIDLLTFDCTASEYLSSQARTSKISEIIFSKPCEYEKQETVTEEHTVKKLAVSVIFVVLGAISFLGALALKKSKQRREYVHNNYNSKQK
ncbi:MAG: hypothetical protein WC900_06285 [Oscillospiraceae bacterium]|jgi:hypothetical protein